MTTLDVQITTNDQAMPLLNALLGKLEDRTDLNKRIADRMEIVTRDHLLKLGMTRHKTAKSLAATPTGYFSRKAEGLESRSTKEEAIVTIPTGNNADGNSGLEAFARVLGPVLITAKAAQWLTIPATAAAYGHRAREFNDLIFIKLGDARAMLARRDGKKLTPFFWLKKSVTLPEDRTLLPSDEQMTGAAEQGAEDLIASLQ